MIQSIFFVVIGLLILSKGADYLVSGSSSLAKKLQVPAIVIGLTIVAFGTSMPEFVVSLIAGVRGETDIAVGNVLGSNIANILLILGISAYLAPIKVLHNTVFKEIPLSLIAVLSVGILANDVFFKNGTQNIISAGDGIILLCFFVIFLSYIFSISKKSDTLVDEVTMLSSNTAMIFAIIGGLAMLIGGGKLVVDGAVTLATFFGISERIIGLTIVAVGTSLPELITSVVAARRGEADLAIGNIVGSNIFNVFFVLGTTSLISPLTFPAGSNFDVWMGIIATLILIASVFIGTKHRLHRWEGITFLIVYLAYISYLIAQ